MPDSAPTARVTYGGGTRRLAASVIGGAGSRIVRVQLEVARRMPERTVHERRREALATAEQHIEAGEPLPAEVAAALAGDDAMSVFWDTDGRAIDLPASEFLALHDRLRAAMPAGLRKEIEAKPIVEDDADQSA